MTTLFHVSATGYNSRKFLVIISIVVSSLIIDISLSNISDLISHLGFCHLYCYSNCICGRAVPHFRFC